MLIRILHFFMNTSINIIIELSRYTGLYKYTHKFKRIEIKAKTETKH